MGEERAEALASEVARLVIPYRDVRKASVTGLTLSFKLTRPPGWVHFIDESADDIARIAARIR